jgi:Zn-dependent alcohol dehydrogenase
VIARAVAPGLPKPDSAVAPSPHHGTGCPDHSVSLILPPRVIVASMVASRRTIHGCHLWWTVRPAVASRCRCAGWLDELVTRTYPMDEIDCVFPDMKAGEVARGVLGIGAT